jgi:diacylglycerol kinase (ATP)
MWDILPMKRGATILSISWEEALSPMWLTGPKKYKALGALSYIFGVLEEITVLKSTSIEMEIDGEKIVREGLFFEICNSRYTGGDMMMAPGALIDDGLFDVVVMNRTSRIKLLKLFPAIFKGTHVNDPVIEVFRGKKISLKTGIPFFY